MSDADLLSQSGAAADKSFRAEPASAPVKGCRNPTWVDYRLTDAKGNPLAGRPFKLTLPDGSIKKGVTDANGLAGIDGIDAGKCLVEFTPPQAK